VQDLFYLLHLNESNLCGQTQAGLVSGVVQNG